MVEINGIIIASEWDSGGKPTAISIMATDEQEYRVEDNEKGRELMDFLRQKATVRGDILGQINRKPVIEVTAYAIEPWDTRLVSID